MKTKLQIIGIALSGLFFASCSSSMYMSKSSVSPTDDIYYTPSKTSSIEVSNEPSKSLNTQDQDPLKTEFNQLERKYARVQTSDSTLADTLVSKVENSNPYQDILVDSYSESYERRLKGMCSASYGMSNLSIYYSDAYFLAKSYDPSFYNIVIVGDQVWVEPWYISNMFFDRRNNFRFGFGISLWSDPYFYDYYNPWLLLDPHWYGSPYGYWNGYPYAYNSNSNNNYYYGRRTENNTNLTSLNRRTGISYESEIISSRRRNELTVNNGTNRNSNTITRNNRTDITTRNGQTNNNQEVINRGTRNENLNTTRLRDDANTRNTNLTEPTRRNNNNTYQRPRSTNNDSYIRTGTRNQNLTNGTTARDNNTRTTSTTRDNRNSTTTYNRPSRVDSSTDRGRSTNSNANTRESSNRGSSTDRSSRSSSASSSGTSSSSSSSSTQQSSSSGSGERRR